MNKHQRKKFISIYLISKKFHQILGVKKNVYNFRKLILIVKYHALLSKTFHHHYERKYRIFCDIIYNSEKVKNYNDTDEEENIIANKTNSAHLL